MNVLFFGSLVLYFAAMVLQFAAAIFKKVETPTLHKNEAPPSIL